MHWPAGAVFHRHLPQRGLVCGSPVAYPEEHEACQVNSWHILQRNFW